MVVDFIMIFPYHKKKKKTKNKAMMHGKPQPSEQVLEKNQVEQLF